MNIIVSSVSQLPIYEQIEGQIRDEILNKELQAGTQLPSIRVLARELQIGVITAKRAYDDLCAEGILVSHQGKGVFVAELDYTQVRNAHIEQLREQLVYIKKYADGAGISQEEIVEVMKQIYEEET